MRSVERSDVEEPESLAESDEVDQARTYYGDPANKTAYKFGDYKKADVKIALDELFYGKCAYCETDYSASQPVDVEHFRPKAGVDHVAGHRGYWWLAARWDNLLPSCIDCNRRRYQKTPILDANQTVSDLVRNGWENNWFRIKTGKQNAFPLFDEAARASGEDDDLDSEVSLLIDPTRLDPSEHLDFYVEANPVSPIAFPRPFEVEAPPRLPVEGADSQDILSRAQTLGHSPFGAASIQIYGLNRLSLVQARTRVLLDCEFLFELMIDLATIGSELQERLNLRKQSIQEATQEEKPRLETDQSFEQEVASKLKSFETLIREKFATMASPEAPYSMMVARWISSRLSAM